MARPFINEKELCDYLELNLDKFCEEIFGQSLKTYKRESYIVPKAFGTGAPRVDFDITLDNDEQLLIECKNPINVLADVSRAISQLLIYGTIAKYPTSLVLVTSKTLPIIQQTILNYELPIKVVYLTKEVLAEWDSDFQKRLNAGEVQVKGQYAIS